MVIFTLASGGSIRDTGRELFHSAHDEKAHGVALAYAALKWGKNIVREHGKTCSTKCRRRGGSVTLARTTIPLAVTDDDGRTHHLPPGTPCTVVDVLGGGAAYIAEFVLEEPVYGPDGHMIEFPLEETAIIEAAGLEPAP